MFNENEDYLMLLNGAIVNMEESSSFMIKGKFPEYIIFTELSGKEYTRGVVRSVCKVEREWIEGYFKKLESVKNGDFEQQVLRNYTYHKVEHKPAKPSFRLTLGDEKQVANKQSVANDSDPQQLDSQLTKRSAEELKAEKIRLAQERLAQRKEIRGDTTTKNKKIKL